MNELIANYVLLFLLLEIYEINWQKAPSMMGMLLRMYRYYKKSIWLFLIMQPTFYFSLCFAILTDYSIAAMLLLSIKTTDIATKIMLIEKVFIKKELSQELGLILLAPINKFLPYIGIIIYPLLIVSAI